jgi:hypothetical protein
MVEEFGKDLKNVVELANFLLKLLMKQKFRDY